MKKKVFGTKFSRNTNSRKALFRGLVGELVEHGAITTTEAKAKAIRRDVDRLALWAVENSMNSQKKIRQYFGNNREYAIKFSQWAKETKPQRTSGFTKAAKLAPRRGDNATLVHLEFVDKKVVVEKTVKKETQEKEVKAKEANVVSKPKKTVKKAKESKKETK